MRRHWLEVELQTDDEAIHVGRRVLGRDRRPGDPDLRHVVAETDHGAEPDRPPVLEAHDEPGQGLIASRDVVPDGLVVALVGGIVHLGTRAEDELAVAQVDAVGRTQFELSLELARTDARVELDPGRGREHRPRVDFGPGAFRQEEELPCELRGDLVDQPTAQDQVLLDLGRHGLDLEVARERTPLCEGGRRQQRKGEDQASELHESLQVVVLALSLLVRTYNNIIKNKINQAYWSKFSTNIVLFNRQD